MPDDVAAGSTGAHLGLFIDTGEGPKPVTVAEWSESLARMCVLYPDKVQAADDETREMVERVRHDDETRRLLQALEAETRTAFVATNTVAEGAARSGQHGRAPRPVGVRRRTRTSPARGDPSDSEPEPPLTLRGGRVTDCLSIAELCASTGASPKRMRNVILADLEARGIAECVGGDEWRLTPAGAAEYEFAFRIIRASNIPLAPGDDDGLDHCKPGPRKAAA